MMMEIPDVKIGYKRKGWTYIEADGGRVIEKLEMLLSDQEVSQISISKKKEN